MYIENFMIEKIKKILCFAISFVLLALNVQVFAQEVQVERAIPENKMLELTKEFHNVREMLLSFRNTFIDKLSRLKKIKGRKHSSKFFENIGLAQEELAKLDEAYIDLLDKTYSYTDYIFEEEGKTALDRLTYKYLGTPGVTIKNYHLKEGAMLEKMRGMLDELEKTWFSAEYFYEIASKAREQETVINDLVTALDERLTEVENVFQRSLVRNNKIYTDNLLEIAENHITREDILKRTIRVIPKEDREAIGLFIKSSNLKASKIELAKGIRNYLVIIGRKDVSPVFKLLQRGVYNTWEAEEFNKAVKSKYGALLDDFPILNNGKCAHPKYTIRRIMRATPIMIVGAVLTAAAITEIRSDNRFLNNSIGAKKMNEIRKKIENNTASFAETVIYYSDESSSSVVNKDTKHLINAINLALAVKQAKKDFSLISNNIDRELQNKYSMLLEQDIQDDFDKSYNSATKKTESLI